MKLLIMVALILVGVLFAEAAQTVTTEAAVPKPVETRTSKKDGALMVWVPAGEFLMGSSELQVQSMLKEFPEAKAEWFTDELPQHTVLLDGYWIYKYEVTVKQYRRFCQETKRSMPELPPWCDKDTYPMVNVSWDDASDYALWAGVRLPTEAEWEKAARGTDGREYPWGNSWESTKCNNYTDRSVASGGAQTKHASLVGSYPTGVSPYGAEDMAGNVWEWCQDWYVPNYYLHSPAKNPPGPKDGETRVLRGGSWGSSSKSTRTTARHADSPDATYHDCGGFRCVMSAKEGS